MNVFAVFRIVTRAHPKPSLDHDGTVMGMPILDWRKAFRHEITPNFATSDGASAVGARRAKRCRANRRIGGPCFGYQGERNIGRLTLVGCHAEHGVTFKCSTET